MKNYITFAVCLILIIPVSAYAQSEEEAKIRAVIEGETHAINHCDYEAFANSWWPEDYCFFSVTSPTMNMTFHGWDEIADWAKSVVEHCNPNNAYMPTKEAYSYVIKEDMAFVTFLEDGGNESTRVLEKRSGQWKLIRMGVIITNAYEVQQKRKVLAGFAGSWKGDPKSMKAEPAPTSWELLDFTFDNEMTPSGIQMQHHRKWHEKGVGNFNYTRRMEVASVPQQEEMAFFTAGHSDAGFSHANNGTALLTDEGVLIGRPLRNGSGELQEKSWMQLKPDGKMHLQVETYDDTGKVDFTFSIDLIRQ
jgi:ketosteroid isomerase-like protein